MLGASGDYGLFGDRDSGIHCKDLALLLFPCVDVEGEAQVNSGIEVGHVVIQIRLADLGISSKDVHDKEAINGVETFYEVIKNRVVDIVDCRYKSVACDGEDHHVPVPCLVCGGVGGTQFLAFDCCGTGWDGWLGWMFNL